MSSLERFPPVCVDNNIKLASKLAVKGNELAPFFLRIGSQVEHPA